MAGDQAEFLRSGYEGLDTHDLLRSPISVLIDIQPAVVPELRKLGIISVFDLGCSWLFANAKAASTRDDPGNSVTRFGISPNDWLGTSAPAVNPEQVASLGVENLRGIDAANVAALKAGMGVETIREFALWPPHRFAASLVAQAYGTVQDAEDRSAEGLRPRLGEYPTERVYYQRLVMLDMGLGDAALKPLDGQVSLNKAIAAAGGGQLQKPAVGALLTFSQSWYAQGITLGHMLHSLALAPGECTRIAVVDWSRRTRASTTEAISESEALDSATQQGRSISEVQSATANDMQSGGSNSWAQSESSSSSIAATVGTGLLTSLWASGDVSASGQQASTASSAGSTSWSNGTRSVNASMTQQVNDSTQQHSTSVRNRRASIVREVSQSEHEAVSTRVVANYNHMHALTVQYYEVVQVYRVSTEVHTAERCLFLPMAPIDFDDDTVIDRFRGVLLRSALNARVANLLVDDATAVAVKGSLVSDAARVPMPVRVLASTKYLKAMVAQDQASVVADAIAARKDG
nr:hypothetical protein [uncultured Cupriavidus sp.]